MKEHQKKTAIAAADAAKETAADAKRKLPGEQIGRYSAATEKDVCRMTRELNNPGESSQDSRG